MRRILIYLFFDADGVVDEYVTHALRAFRDHVDFVFVVSNSPLTEDGRDRLEAVADLVWVRENVGFDAWAYKEALAVIGPDRLAGYDEVVLANYTFYGPVYPFGETFARMDERPELDFWGLTAHKAVAADPLDDASVAMHLHLQTHWIAVRRSMASSTEWAQYWEQLPAISSYQDSVRRHEARFTEHFANRGFEFAVAFPPEDYPVDHPVFDAVLPMLSNRCPIVKRRTFFLDPVLVDRTGVRPDRVLAAAEDAGYPVELIRRNLIRTMPPRDLYTNLAMMSVLPDTPRAAPADPPRVCVLAHLFYPERVAALLADLAAIPVPFDLVVTTDTDAKRADIVLEVRKAGLADADIRVIEPNDGWAESAFLVGCRDVLTSGRYDLVLKVHTKRSPRELYNNRDVIDRHTVENLLASPGYVANLLDLFAADPSLGMVFPPLLHLGVPTLGHYWRRLRGEAEQVAAQCGLRAVLDADTPLAPYAGMFWARPQALGALLEFEYEDFAVPEADAVDGDEPPALRDVVERLYCHAAHSAGFSVRTAVTPHWAAVDYTRLEYKTARVAAHLPGFTQDQIDYLDDLEDVARQARERVPDPPLVALKWDLYTRHPRLAQVLSPAYGAARTVLRRR